MSRCRLVLRSKGHLWDGNARFCNRGDKLALEVPFVSCVSCSLPCWRVGRLKKHHSGYVGGRRQRADRGGTGRDTHLKPLRRKSQHHKGMHLPVISRWVQDGIFGAKFSPGVQCRP